MDTIKAGWRGTGLPNPSRETKFSGTNADREICIFRVQPTTCRTGNLTRLIHTLAIRVTVHMPAVSAFQENISFVFSEPIGGLLFENVLTGCAVTESKCSRIT